MVRTRALVYDKQRIPYLLSWDMTYLVNASASIPFDLYYIIIENCLILKFERQQWQSTKLNQCHLELYSNSDPVFVGWHRWNIISIYYYYYSFEVRTQRAKNIRSPSSVATTNIYTDTVSVQNTTEYNWKRKKRRGEKKKRRNECISSCLLV